MSDEALQETTDSGMTSTIAVRVSDELNDKINKATIATKLNQSAMLRLAIDRGLDRLLEQLGVEIPTP